MGPSRRNLNRVCFNAHNFYHMRWMTDKTVVVPDDEGHKFVELAFFGDYDLASDYEAVVVRYKTFYMVYNMAKGYNSETPEFQNQVVIVERGPADQPGTAWRAALDKDNRNFDADGDSIRLCHTEHGGPDSIDKVLLSFAGPCNDMDESLLVHHGSPMPTSAPTWRPSSQPTRSPSILPSMGPSMLPSIGPSSSFRPSGLPTTSPSHLPSLSAAPSLEPTATPSTQPSISSQPSRVPSDSPSSVPSIYPSDFPSTFTPKPTTEGECTRRKFLEDCQVPDDCCSGWCFPVGDGMKCGK